MWRRCLPEFKEKWQSWDNRIARQQARARARQARAKVREQQVQRERRLAKWGEQVAVALAERDAVVSDCEQRAGQALRSLIRQEGLSTRKALAWYGEERLTVREMYRLIREADSGDGDQEGPDGAQGAGGKSAQDEASVAEVPDSLTSGQLKRRS